MNNYDVIVVGTVCCDLIFYGMSSLPEPGEEIWTEGLEVSAGGAINTPAALSRLGLEVGLTTPVGRDVWGKIILSNMEEEQISTELIHYMNQPFPQISVALNYDDDRSFISYGEKPDNASYHDHLKKTVMDQKAGIVHFYSSSDDGFIEVMKEAKKSGKLVTLDTGWDPKWLVSGELKQQIKVADVFLPNLKEAQIITGKQDKYDALNELSKLSAMVVIKLGEEGAICKYQSKVIESPTEKVRAIDTTGAGDCFVGGFLYGMLENRPMRECLWMGNFAGKACVSAVGGYNGAPTRTEMLGALKEHQSMLKE